MNPSALVQLKRRAAWRVRSSIRLLRSDREFGAGFKPGLLCRGFFSYRSLLYPFHQYDRRWFLNDWAIETRLHTVNPPDVGAQLGNKLYCHFLLRELGLGDKTAPLIGVLRGGSFTSFSRYATIGAALAHCGRVVAKPLCGFGGSGVQLIDREDALPSKGVHLIEAVITQHPYAATVFPGSVNTIRVMTLRHNAGEPPFIAGAAHRFGVASSAPVDNFSQGGVAAHVDLESGTLSSGFSQPGMHRQFRYERHPDSGAVFSGLRIPMWEEVKELALQLAAKIPGLKLAGWDICVTSDGPRLIEGNGRAPHPELIQTYRPLLLDPRVRRFFADTRVISRALVDELAALEREGDTQRIITTPQGDPWLAHLSVG